ncbi:MAG: hypothetical protein AAB365_01325 [Patescibacteria group bacterium]
MVYTKDRVTRETLMKLLAYSLAPECQVLLCIKPPTNIVNDGEIKKTSVISFQKVEEKVFKFSGKKPDDQHHRAFTIKVVVEDEHLEWIDDKKEDTVLVPVSSVILNKVAQILNAG